MKIGWPSLEEWGNWVWELRGWAGPEALTAFFKTLSENPSR